MLFTIQTSEPLIPGPYLIPTGSAGIESSIPNCKGINGLLDWTTCFLHSYGYRLNCIINSCFILLSFHFVHVVMLFVHLVWSVLFVVL